MTSPVGRCGHAFGPTPQASSLDLSSADRPDAKVEGLDVGTNSAILAGVLALEQRVPTQRLGWAAGGCQLPSQVQALADGASLVGYTQRQLRVRLHARAPLAQVRSFGCYDPVPQWHPPTHPPSGTRPTTHPSE